eukprot:884059-Prymnesium_polylepis.1
MSLRTSISASILQRRYTTNPRSASASPLTSPLHLRSPAHQHCVELVLHGRGVRCAAHGAAATASGDSPCNAAPPSPPLAPQGPPP